MAGAIAALLPITTASGRSMGGHPGMGPRFFSGNGFGRGHEFAFRHREFGPFRGFDRDDRFFAHRRFFDRDDRFFHHRDRFFFGFEFAGYPYPYWYPGYPWYPYWC